MASYFDEHDCEPSSRNSAEQSAIDRYPNLLHLVRSLLAGDDLPNWFTEIAGIEDTENDGLAPPASHKAVAELTRRGIRRSEYEDEIKCPVCIVHFDEEDILVELPCEHAFHDHCILPWLEKTNSCPNCRRELQTDNAEYERRKKEKQEEEERETRAQDYQNAMFG